MESLLQPGRQFRPGEILQELPGELEISEKPVAGGGFANIYHGFWTDAEGVRKEVAIKEIRALVLNANQNAAQAEELQRKRIGRELFIWSQTKHPNLQPLIGYQSQPRPRLICPWAPHGNLADYLQKNPGLSRSQKLLLIYQTGLGLNHLHSQIPPICHADIKPENVLINAVCEAALCDFGISRVLQESRSGFTTSATAKGTMAYMAPELFLEENTSLQSDVYAFGGLILKVMTGKAPFYSSTNQEFVFAQVVKGHWPDPQAYPELPVTDLLWRLIRRCWTKDPNARPTMPEVLAELSLHIQSEGLMSPGLLSTTNKAGNPSGGTLDANQSRNVLLFSTVLGVMEIWLEAIPVLVYVWKLIRLWWARHPEAASATHSETSSSVALTHTSASTFATTITISAPSTTSSTTTIGSIAEKATLVAKILEQSQSKLHVVSLIGRYIESLANVGQDLIKMTQTSDADNEISRNLILRTWRLAQLVEDLQDKLKTPNQDLSSVLTDIRRELEWLRDGVTDQQRFYQEDSSRQLARQTSEEIELLLDIDTKQLSDESTSTKAQDERRQLLSVLGDGRHGVQGNMIGEAVCLPGTRVDVLEEIDEWVRSSNSRDRAVWLRGMAGRGKSTIASTIVQRWKHRASCAIFHFRRGQSNLDSFIICSLAKQLGNSMVTKVRDAIVESVRHHPDIAEERLDEQLKTLITAPLSSLGEGGPPALMVVDGLDECENTPFALELLKLIDQQSSTVPINVKFVFTSRPEIDLRRAFESKVWGAINLDSLGAIQGDLKLFIQHGCEQIRAEHKLHKHWPSKRQVDKLVEMSQGLFQWAKTAIAFIGKRSPEARLREFLSRPWAWNGLSDIYYQILDQAFTNLDSEPEKQELLRRTLGTLVVAPHPISLDVLATLHTENEVFQGLDSDGAIKLLQQEILADLNSLILLPNSPTEPVHLLHTSIRDLFVAKQRKIYQIDLRQQHETLANRSLDFMLANLKKTVCKITSLSTSDHEVQEVLESQVSHCLRYCCRAWAIHLAEGVTLLHGVEGKEGTWAKFMAFSKNKVLCWLEVMVMVGATTEAINLSVKVQQWLSTACSKTEETKQMTRLWYDIQRFIIKFSDPISLSPAHIYASGLAHCPENTLLFEWYREQADIRSLGVTKTSTWSSEIWTRIVGSQVTSVTFSSDGKTLATGSIDSMIRLWDAQSGTPLKEPMKEHTDYVYSLTFSPDNKTLASGSDDCTIRLWDVQSGTPLREPLAGHSERVASVAFAPDGQILASGSNDRTIRLWNVQTGTPLKDPLEGHEDSIKSIAFSPDGKTIVSGSNDATIRIWSVETGTALREPLRGHFDWVRSVAFSPDGQIIASGSDDRTIRLWDSQSGTPLREPLVGHTGWVRAIAFSPDGQTIASGSDDHAIRLWDVATGTAVNEPLEGHTGSVWSVAFSPDSKTLASGSTDSKIRLWDITSSEPSQEHGDMGGILAFSPDGQILASSVDNAVRLWDTRRGAPLTEPLEKHSNRVQCLSFSPDGRILASGSADCTLRLWDVDSGTLLGEPLEGHTDWVQSLAFSPNGKIIASGADDHTIRIWDVESRTSHQDALVGHTGNVFTVGFSPDGKILASGASDSSIRLWDAQTGAPLREPIVEHRDWIRSVAFSPDGKTLASCSDDWTIRLWDVPSGNPFGDPLTGHGGWVWSVAFSPDGRNLRSSARDKTIRLWDVPSGGELQANPSEGKEPQVSSEKVQNPTLENELLQDHSSDHTEPAVTEQISRSTSFWPGHVSFDGEWISLSGARRLWVPPDYQTQMNFESLGYPPIAMSHDIIVIVVRKNVFFFKLPHNDPLVPSLDLSSS